jgi:hypothetical protein
MNSKGDLIARRSGPVTWGEQSRSSGDTVGDSTTATKKAQRLYLEALYPTAWAKTCLRAGSFDGMVSGCLRAGSAISKQCDFEPENDTRYQC